MSETAAIAGVLHPSDFSEASHEAFFHALAIVLYCQADLTVLHVVPGDEAVDVWIDAPQIRATLTRWGLLEEGSPRSAVYDKLSLGVSKINVRSDDPIGAIVDHLQQRPSDLIVLATERRTGLPRWLHRSVAENVARQSKTMTLFVPNQGRGFVSRPDGKISLKRILVPVDHVPSPQTAILHAASFAVMSHEAAVEIDLLRVGADNWPPCELPELRTCRWNRVQRQGKTVEQIVAAADETAADLIVMATAGAKGILGALRGSVTEKVLRRAPCALLAVPAANGESPPV